MVPPEVLLALLTADAATGSNTASRAALNCPFDMRRGDGRPSSTSILAVADPRDPLLEYLRSRHLQAALSAGGQGIRSGSARAYSELGVSRAVVSVSPRLARSSPQSRRARTYCEKKASIKRVLAPDAK
jgi:hypothetical protein